MVYHHPKPQTLNVWYIFTLHSPYKFCHMQQKNMIYHTLNVWVKGIPTWLTGTWWKPPQLAGVPPWSTTAGSARKGVLLIPGVEILPGWGTGWWKWVVSWFHLKLTIGIYQLLGQGKQNGFTGELNHDGPVIQARSNPVQSSHLRQSNKQMPSQFQWWTGQHMRRPLRI